MQTRWWRRGFSGLPIPALLAVSVTLAGAAGGSVAPVLELRGPEDRLLAEVTLQDGEFTLRYRNSLYRSVAEERYEIGTEGEIRLVGIAADELAVLEEYYAIDDPAARAAAEAARAWVAAPAGTVVIDRLVVAATDLGQRTLVVDGHRPLELWRLVDDAAPSVEFVVRMP